MHEINKTIEKHNTQARMSENEISIKVNICDRFYPLRLKPSEEESVRMAAKKINERAKFYIDNFSVQDKQDALSMIALEFATEDKTTAATHIESEPINAKLKELEQMLEI